MAIQLLHLILVWHYLSQAILIRLNLALKDLQLRLRAHKGIPYVILTKQSKTKKFFHAAGSTNQSPSTK